MTDTHAAQVAPVIDEKGKQRYFQVGTKYLRMPHIAAHMVPIIRPFISGGFTNGTGSSN